MTQNSQNSSEVIPLKGFSCRQYHLDEKREDIKYDEIIKDMISHCSKSSIEGYTFKFQQTLISNGEELKTCLKDIKLSDKKIHFMYDFDSCQNIKITLVQKSIKDLNQLLKKYIESEKQRQEIILKHAEEEDKNNEKYRSLLIKIDRLVQENSQVERINVKNAKKLKEYKINLEYIDFQKKSTLLEVEFISSTKQLTISIEKLNQKYIQALKNASINSFEQFNLIQKLKKKISMLSAMVTLYKKKIRSIKNDISSFQEEMEVFEEEHEIRPENCEEADNSDSI